MSNTKQGFSFKNFFTTLTRKKAILIIIIVGVIVFFNSLFNNFVEDDILYIINYPPIHQLNLPFSFGKNIFNGEGQYRPIPATYFSLLYTLFGSQAFYYHFLQLTLHIANAILLYLLLSFLFVTINAKTKEMEEKEWNSLSGSQKIKYQRMHGSVVKASPVQEQRANLLFLFLSLVFLVHPINVESVSYIGNTQSNLFTLFGLIPLLLLIRKDLSLKSLIVCFSLLLLSLLTKETGVLFLFLIIFYGFLFARKNEVKLLIGSFIILVVYAFFRLGIGHVGLATRHLATIARLSLPERLMNMPIIIFYYLKTFFFPMKLAIDQNWVITSVGFSNFYLPFLVDGLFFALLGLFGVYVYKQQSQNFKPYLFFSAWFIVGLLFHLQIFPLDWTVADRWMYFPIVGLLGILGVGAQILVKNERVKQVTIVSSVLILILLSLRTIVRNTNFYDDMTLLTHDSKIHDNKDIENNLGRDFFLKGDYNEALKHFQKSVEFQPTFYNLFDLGLTYEDMNTNNSVIAARDNFFKLLNYDVSDYSIAIFDDYFSVASSKLLQNDYLVVARKFIIRALQKVPDSWRLWGNLAISEYALHNQQAALIAAEKAKTLHPSEQTNLLYTVIVQKKGLPTNLIDKFQP